MNKLEKPIVGKTLYIVNLKPMDGKPLILVN